MTEKNNLPCARCGRPVSEHVALMTYGPQEPPPPVLICPRSIYQPEPAFHSIGDGLEADFTDKPAPGPEIWHG